MVPQVSIDATVPFLGPSEVYEKITKFEDYAQHCPDVRSVSVQSHADGTSTSTWEVSFRGGVMRWTELDTFDENRLTTSFEQTAGDLNIFRGAWSISAAGDSTRIVFGADYDVGIATLAEFLNPVAGRAIASNIVSIITSLCGSGTDFISTEVNYAG